MHSDLRSRKKTLPIVAALTSQTPAGRAFAARYHQQEPLSEGELGETANRIETAGGKAWSSARADALLDQALNHLDAAAPRPRTGALRELAHLATRRDQ